MYENNLKVRMGMTHQQKAAEGKMHYYPTDIISCTSISGLMRFPEGEEVCVLEPSIGEGSAVIAVTGASKNPNIKIFGVELDPVRAAEAKEKPEIEDVINEDFTNGVQISNQKFSFVFGNPPYADTADAGPFKERQEKLFLDKVKKYMKKGGILVWVIPYRIFSEQAYIRTLLNDYEFLHVWKFRKEEYDKWKQIVFIGRKRAQSRYSLVSEVQETVEKYDQIEKIEELPSTFEGTELYHSIEVVPTDSEAVTTFATIKFDADKAAAHIAQNPPLQEHHKVVSDAATIRKFRASNIGRPPIRPKKDSLHLMGVSGAGQGIAGTLGDDLHLQRGNAEIVETIVYEDNPSGESIMKVTTHTSVTMTVGQTNGVIDFLT